MGLIQEETLLPIADTEIMVVEREKGEEREPWKFITLHVDGMQEISPKELRLLGRMLINEGKRIGKQYKSNGAERTK